LLKHVSISLPLLFLLLFVLWIASFVVACDGCENCLSACCVSRNKIGEPLE
jgi:hypothetical protein